MKTITSKENPLLKSIKKIAALPKERKKLGKTILDGIHLVTTYHLAGGHPDVFIISSSARGNPEIQGFLDKIMMDDLIVLSDELFREISTVDAPTGIMALISIPQPSKAEENCCVLLEDIQDPGNLGSILRSAAAAGIRILYLSSGCADAWSPKVLRAGMGAHFHLSIHENIDLLSVAQSFSGQVMVTDLSAKVSIFELDLRGPTAFVIGNEGAGVSESLLKIADIKTRIPMPGSAESLNVAAAAAILFFERVRQMNG